MLKDDDKKENIKGVQAVEKNTEKKNIVDWVMTCDSGLPLMF